MSALLDTCTLLWAARDPAKLSRRIRDLLLNPDQELVISVASAWEITVKPELGIYDTAAWFRTAARKLQARVLSIQIDHIAVLGTLPPLHKDPFDRMLIAQALAGNLDLLTNDEAIRRYDGVRCVWE